MVDPDKKEVVHLYVVPEKDLSPKKDPVGVFIALLCSLLLVALICLIVISPKAPQTVSFTLSVRGFYLPEESQSETVRVSATGNGHVDATEAAGTITFYNGAIYAQIIPVGTILKGTDGVEVITDAPATIPPAAATFPPTYGRINVPAHALTAGETGNIEAGDINEACCATSVIAQNPYSFSGGVNAYDFTYLTSSDASKAVSANAPALEKKALSLFRVPVVLDPKCKVESSFSVPVGTHTASSTLSLRAECSAVSYSQEAVKSKILALSGRNEWYENAQYSIVGITEKKNIIVLHLYVTATVIPVIRVPVR